MLPFETDSSIARVEVFADVDGLSNGNDSSVTEDVGRFAATPKVSIAGAGALPASIEGFTTTARALTDAVLVLVAGLRSFTVGAACVGG